MELTAEVLVAGRASGDALVLDEPLSFWGGVDPLTGEIIDRHHPQSGECVAGRVLVMSHGRGSSSASYVLAECIRSGSAPAAIVLETGDGIIALGALVAAELYPERQCPVLVVGDGYAHLTQGAQIRIDGAALTVG